MVVRSRYVVEIMSYLVISVALTIIGNLSPFIFLAGIFQSYPILARNISIEAITLCVPELTFSAMC